MKADLGLLEVDDIVAEEFEVIETKVEARGMS